MEVSDVELGHVYHCIDAGAKAHHVSASIKRLVRNMPSLAVEIIHRMRPHNLCGRDWDYVLCELHYALMIDPYSRCDGTDFNIMMETIRDVGIQLLKWGAKPDVPVNELYCAWQQTIEFFELCRKEAATIVWCNKRNGCVLSKDMLRMIGMILYDLRVK